MVNPRRSSFSSNTQNSDSNSLNIHNFSRLSFLMNFLKRPQAFPLLLSIFVFVTWVSLRLQHSDFSKSQNNWSSIEEDDVKANLVRFNSHFPSPISKDKRGWLFNPVSLALESGVKGMFIYMHLFILLFIIIFLSFCIYFSVNVEALWFSIIEPQFVALFL